MTASPSPPQQSFAALRHPAYRMYLAGNMLAMMADSIEHVISYWVVFQKFQSPALGGFAVISHWVPYLLFSIYVGGLSDRYDPRRLVQIGMGLFMLASLGWAALFLTDSLEVWHAVVLLSIHGMAGVFWGPPGQMLIHDIVGDAQVPSAVRLMATSRYLGMIAGPAVGSAFLILFGPSLGLFLNALFYLPLALWLRKAPYGPKFRASPQMRRALTGFADLMATIRDVAADRTLLSMTLLAGSAAFMITPAYHAQMPEFARDLGYGDPGAAYSILLLADALGALTAGIVLEGGRWLSPNPRTAIILTMGWTCAIAGFATTSFYPLAIALLFAAGFLELSFLSMAQALVQLGAPAEIRGRILGLYSTVAFGSRAFSGVTVGLMGEAVGIHRSLAGSAVILFAIVVTLYAVTRRPRGS